MATDYGRDRSCTLRTVTLEYPDGSFREVTAVQSSLTQTEVTGRTCLAEALVRRLMTDGGTLIDVLIPSTTADYGTNITDYANDDIDARGLGLVASAVTGEVIKDERVVSANTTATLAGSLLIVTIDITDGAGPFKLVLSISDAAVQLLTGPA